MQRNLKIAMVAVACVFIAAILLSLRHEPREQAGIELPDDLGAPFLDVPIVAERLPQTTLRNIALPQDGEFNAYGESCDVSMAAHAKAHATVQLVITAPCKAGMTVRIGHMGLRIDERLSPLGRLDISLPALDSAAVFNVVFADGERGAIDVDIKDFAQVRRIGLQWKGDTGLGIDVRQVGSGPAAVQIGTFGHPALADGWRAQIVTVARTAPKPQVVRVAVAAPVTEATCGRQLAATTLEQDLNGVYRATPVTLAAASCDRVGDILVLKNLLRDLRIAIN